MKWLWHSAPVHSIESIQETGLAPRRGGGLFSHGAYAEWSQGKLFLSDNPSAARAWHGKVEDQLFSQYDDEGRHSAAILRAASMATSLDEVGDPDVRGSRFVTREIAPEKLRYFDGEQWAPLESWAPGDDKTPESDEDFTAPNKRKKRRARIVKNSGPSEHEKASRQVRDKHAARVAEWADKSADEREAKAAEMLAKSPVPGMSVFKVFKWGEILRVDGQGKAL